MRRRCSNSISVLLLSLIIFALSSSAAATDCNSISRGRYHALVCWLWDAKIHLPNEQFKEEVFTISVTKLSCTNFQVTSTKSSYIPSSSSADGAKNKKTNPSLQIDLTGISATCNGNYAWSGIGSGSGNVVASVSGNSDSEPLHLEMDVASAPLSDHVKHYSANNNTTTKASLPFPTLATLSSCQPNFSVHDVQFTGSASAKIIGLFSRVISNKLTAVLNQHVCSLIKENGEKAIDEAFHAAGEYLGGLILKHSSVEDKSTSPESFISLAMQRSDIERTLHKNIVENNSVVSWDGDMPLLKRILLGFNNFIRDHMNEGIILKKLQTINPSICEDCGFFFKGFNGMVNSLTRGTGSLDFTVPETILSFHRNHTFNIPEYGNVTISSQKVKVSGLNNLTELSLFRPLGQNMMSSSIASNAGLCFTILMNMEVIPTNGGAFQGDTLNESFELKFNMSNVNLATDSMFVFDREVLNKLTVGSFISGSYTTFDSNRNILNCVLEALSSIVLTNLEGRMNLDNMSIAAITNAEDTSAETSLEDNVDEVVNNMLQLFLLEYPSTVTESLAAMVQTPARELVNSALSKFMGDYKQLPLHCVNVEVPKNAVERSFRFDENIYLWMFDNLFDGENMIGTVNSFMNCVSNLLTQNTTSLSFRLGDIHVGLDNLKLANFGSVYELDLLLPDLDHYHIKNKFGWGNYTELSFGMNFTHPHHGRIGKMTAQLMMKDLELTAGTEILYDLNYMPTLEITDLLAQPQCYALPVTNFELYDFNMTIDSLDLTTSLDIGHDGQKHTFSYKTTDPTKLATIVTTIMSDGAVKLQQALERSLAVEMNEASRICSTPANRNRRYNSRHQAKTAAGVWTLLIVVVFVVSNSWLFLKGCNSDEYDGDGVRAFDEQKSKLTQPLLNSSNDESRNNSQDGMDEVMEVESPHPRKFPLSSSTSLMYHQSIHKTIKFGVPVLLALTIILLLSSNLSIGASVDLQMTKSNGQSLTSFVNIYQFSLSSTLGEMWRAGVYMLMLLIWFCSGVWPYIKLILLLFCWITSTRRLPPIKREKILYLLDCLGKFSLIDTFVLVLMMVAFRYNLEVAGIGSLDVYVTPKFGFYSFLFATIVSLVSGHAILFLHRRSTLPIISVCSGRYESLSRHIFDDKHGRGLLKMTRFFRQVVIFTIFLTCILIVIGANLHSFHFTFNGVAGVALGETRVREFSLVSIGESIPQSVQKNSSSFGIHLIKTTYFFFALVMPIVCLILLLVIFVVPMRMRRQQQIFILVEVTNAWSAIEVFILAILASLVEIGPLSSSMVEQHCSLLDKMLSGFTGSGGDDLHHCYSVKSSIDSSCAILIAGVILNSLLVSTLHRLCHHALWERIEREDRPDASADESNAVRECVLAHIFVSKLRETKLGYVIFEEISPHGEFEVDFENVVEDEEPGSAGFWNEWHKMVSVI